MPIKVGDAERQRAAMRAALALHPCDPGPQVVDNTEIRGGRHGLQTERRRIMFLFCSMARTGVNFARMTQEGQICGLVRITGVFAVSDSSPSRLDEVWTGSNPEPAG